MSELPPDEASIAAAGADPGHPQTVRRWCAEKNFGVLWRQVIPEINRRQSLTQAPITAGSEGAPERRTARAADAQTVGTPEQRDADVAAAQEFHQIKKFVAAVRRQWPGAMIVLRPNQVGAPAGASAPPNPETGTRS
jgi:hypothetical protein